MKNFIEEIKKITTPSIRSMFQKMMITFGVSMVFFLLILGVSTLWLRILGLLYRIGI